MLLDKIFKFVNGEICAFEYCPQCSGFYGFGTMKRYHRSACKIKFMTHYDMRTALSKYDKLRFFQSPDYTVPGNLRQRKNVQIATSISSSKTSDSGRGILSSMRDWTYRLIASFAFFKHSSSVSPCVAQPGRDGTETEYPPSASGSNIILNLFRDIPTPPSGEEILGYLYDKVNT